MHNTCIYSVVLVVIQYAFVCIVHHCNLFTEESLSSYANNVADVFDAPIVLIMLTVNSLPLMQSEPVFYRDT